LSIEEEERRLAAIMFTDIVGYTALSHQNEALALELLQWHSDLLRPIFKRHGGREVKSIGDGFLVEFSSALEATRCALEVQETLHLEDSTRPPDKRILVRIGIHIGDVVHSKGDLFGDAVNIASRIEPFAEPGGICITNQVHEDVGNKIGLACECLGLKELKNVDTPIEVYKISLPWAATQTRIHDMPQRRRIAILPIANISENASDEYFTDGLTEELIATLSLIPSLKVIARTSVSKYKNASKGIGEIGQELNVGVVLEGSVRKAGNRIRATFELIDTSTEEHLWTHSYDSDLKDVFDIQRHMAHKVAEALKIELKIPERKKLSKPAPTHDTEAHNLYLKGRFHFNRGLEEGFGKAKEYYALVLERDQNYALAYVGIAECEIESSFFDELSSKDAYPNARELVDRALTIDGSLAEAHACLARIFFLFDKNFSEAEREIRRALEINPNLPEVHSAYARFLLYTGRTEEAIKEAKRAFELDPLSAPAYDASGTVYLYSRQFEKAIEDFQSALELDREDALAHSHLGMAYANVGKFKDAVSSAEKAVALTAFARHIARTDLMFVYNKSGRTDDARKILEDLKAESTTRHVSHVALARGCAILNEKEEGLKWLELAAKENSTHIMSIGVDFCFDSIRMDLRFDEILRRIGLQQVTFAR
jgi:adenylate cyclase